MIDNQTLPLELEALKKGAGFVVAPNVGEVELAGADRIKFMHNFCTSDIKKMEQGSACETFMLDAKGKILFFAMVVCLEDRIRLLLFGGDPGQAIEHLDKYLIMEKVELRNLSESNSILIAAGQQVSEKLSAFHIDGESVNWAATSENGDIDWIADFDGLNQDAFLMSVPKDSIDKVRSDLEAAGAQECSHDSFEMLRVQKCFPFYGEDITPKNLAQEIDRTERTISFVKGCYIGQETVARLDALGHVNKKIVGIEFETDAAPKPLDPLFAGEKQVGEVRSVGFSFESGKAIAIAMVRVSAIEQKERLVCGDLQAKIISS